MKLLPTTFLVLVFFTKSCFNERRIARGDYTLAEKRFMVYLLPSELSNNKYDSWMCAGAIISETQVLTAAGCLLEVSNLYVIAGYKKYVNWKAVEYDKCTKNRKNRVIRTCTPKEYILSYDNRSDWMRIDVGVAIVENPYNFSDESSWKKFCSYPPNAIQISYDYIPEATDVLAYSWGSSYSRMNFDVLDPNSEYLREMATQIANKSICTFFFSKPSLINQINKNCICTDGEGNLGGDGKLKDIGNIGNVGYKKGVSRLRRQMGKDRVKDDIGGPALCQNDHGAPLVTWIGSTEVLIGTGITSVLYKNDNNCRSPSIFVSMHCTGKIVHCLTAVTDRDRRRCADDNKLKILFDESTINWREREAQRAYKEFLSYGK